MPCERNIRQRETTETQKTKFSTNLFTDCHLLPKFWSWFRTSGQLNLVTWIRIASMNVVCGATTRIWASFLIACWPLTLISNPPNRYIDIAIRLITSFKLLWIMKGKQNKRNLILLMIFKLSNRNTIKKFIHKETLVG